MMVDPAIFFVIIFRRRLARADSSAKWLQMLETVVHVE
jgi:hypothetical protein